ncbi:MAG TPA: hypothetical protein VGM37_01425 [Armatimonadota bacterium]|jgi:hypothetical protein
MARRVADGVETGDGPLDVVAKWNVMVGAINANFAEIYPLRAAATLDFASIAAGSAAELTVTVTGASAGKPAIASPAAGIEAGLVWSAWVSAADTVRIRVANVTAAAIDPASRAWSVVAFP